MIWLYSLFFYSLSFKIWIEGCTVRVAGIWHHVQDRSTWDLHMVLVPPEEDYCLISVKIYRLQAAGSDLSHEERNWTGFAWIGQRYLALQQLKSVVPTINKETNMYLRFWALIMFHYKLLDEKIKWIYFA